MLITNKQALERLSSSSNLMNRLRATDTKSRSKAMDLFGVSKNKNNSEALVQHAKPTLPSSVDDSKSDSRIQSTEPSLDELLEDPSKQIKLSLAHDKAIDILEQTLKHLECKLDDIKPEKLPGVISSVSKMVEGIRREKLEVLKNRKEQNIQINFYTPTQRTIKEYDIIEVG